ncbi:MAG: MBL fold metallo-hydrolase [Gammaproteobacteria bacterium]|nr:MBL fold metallo-hydrolase [Gammaproteobacteria bacterium]
MQQQTRTPLTSNYHNGIIAVDADYIRPYMATIHLVKEGDGAEAMGMIVDTGTSHSVPMLLATLEEQKLLPEQITLVCLTHIHLDHAGGAGQLMQLFPNATLYVHPRGARHMIDPSKLIAGTIGVYGENLYKQLYDEILPIDASRVHEVQDGDILTFGSRRFELIHTEGHARHHYCLVDAENGDAFTGDSFGVSYRETDHPKNGHFIFPTTTPVHFDVDAAHASIERLMSYDLKHVYLTHYSQRSHLKNCAQQLHDDLEVYVQLTKQAFGKKDPQDLLEKTLYQHLSERLDKHGFTGDSAAVKQVIGPDTKLNAAGLMHWAQTTLV